MNLWNVIPTGIDNDHEDCGQISLGEGHMGPEDKMWSYSRSATAYRSLILCTSLTMGILILVNYGPIWKCGPLRESMMAISRRVDGSADLINLEG